MLNLKYLPLVWAGIWRKRGRAVLMLLQIASAFALFGLLEGFNTGIKQAIAATHRRPALRRQQRLARRPAADRPPRTHQSPRPASRSSTTRSGLPAHVPTARSASRRDRGRRRARSSRSTTSSARRKTPSTRSTNNRTGVLVGKVTMQKYGWKVGDRVVLESPVPKTDGSRDWAFDIVGEYDKPDDPANATALICNFAYFNEARLDGPRQRAGIRREDRQRGERRPRSALPSTTRSRTPTTRRALNRRPTWPRRRSSASATSTILVRAIIGAVFFALLFATGALMMQSIRERVPRARGAEDRRVLRSARHGLDRHGSDRVLRLLGGCRSRDRRVRPLPLARQLIGIAAMPRIVHRGRFRLRLAARADRRRRACVARTEAPGRRRARGPLGGAP